MAFRREQQVRTPPPPRSCRNRLPDHASHHSVSSFMSTSCWDFQVGNACFQNRGAPPTNVYFVFSMLGDDSARMKHEVMSVRD